MTSLTLGQTATELHRALRDYIEATYHISDPGLVERRRGLLDDPGVIGQLPYLESTPRYVGGTKFEQLGLPRAAEEILLKAASVEDHGSRLVHNPPYQHQAASLQATLNDGRSIVVTTGTGSGKTECFLLPILGRLALQATSSSVDEQNDAVKALVLYPMNALVNDQLGRLRRLLGNPELAKWFEDRWGRPVRFARYTSRTLYPGVRTAKRDQERLRPLRRYYVEIEKQAAGLPGEAKDANAQLLAELKNRGKWPSKPSLAQWYGDDGTRWQNQASRFQRGITLPEDSELLTRHEVLDNPPDVLITNYSMLEYMLMRPLERPLFEATRDWLARHPDEKFLIVVDEAHLYRGAGGTEVALLLRRLRDRMDIDASRLQVICTTASFSEAARAPAFGARLTGKEPEDFDSIVGSLALRAGAAAGSSAEADVLGAVDIDGFYQAGEADRFGFVQSILDMRGVTGGDVETALHGALVDFAPMKLLVNETMQRAQPVSELARTIFPDVASEVAERATTSLVALGSFAREVGAMDGPGLLPSRLHTFFRGLPGLWVCVDGDCNELPPEKRTGVAGQLYGQPMARCPCGARVFELFTCRHCGTAYVRAYTDTIDSITFLWSIPGETFISGSGQQTEMEPIDILLGQPLATDGVRPADLDIVTGRLDPQRLGLRNRTVYLPDRVDDHGIRSGDFKPCAVCGKAAGYGRSSVQDHQTKGDEPFQALVTRQIEIQQPSATPTPFAPMAGRKVLVFSDSRQTAARLAPNLQRYTTRDAIRPLLLTGFASLAADPDVSAAVTLEESYLAVLLAMVQLGVRLRPATRIGETFQSDVDSVVDYLREPTNPSAVDKFRLLLDFRSRSSSAPEVLAKAIHDVSNDQYTGLAALALASIEPSGAGFVSQLPALGPSLSTEYEKRSVIRTWIDAWHGPRLQGMPTAWAEDEISPKSGKFAARMKTVLPTRAILQAFDRDWLPILLANLAVPVGKEFVLRGAALTLDIGGEWGYCQTCRSSQRPFAGQPDLCSYCGQRSVSIIDPDTDPVFRARKGYYRLASTQALEDKRAPTALVAAEHTAQINDAQADEVFSEAEENELLFQDVDLGDRQPAIDVLSCTTTMEVGIDIGSLSGVALRNMPPARANYQQRSGRAGRRGKSIATVIAYASASSHDEHGFAHPQEFIRGPVDDPEMSLDNWAIARRHLTAFVLQEYLRTRLPELPSDDEHYGAQLFEVLGSVADFLRPSSPLSSNDLREWIDGDVSRLSKRAGRWLPRELGVTTNGDALVREIRATADIVDAALGIGSVESPVSPSQADTSEEAPGVEVQSEPGDSAGESAAPPETLLGRLLYKGALPRYAFPTDVGTFHVFDAQRSTRYRPAFRYTPGQGMAAALTQYAPGKRVWIGGREWMSGAVYSRVSEDRFAAWSNRALYLECSTCHYAMIETFDSAGRGGVRDCPACGSVGQFGPAQTWFRPPGFAHPYSVSENTSPDDDVPRSYATRAKLTTAAPADAAAWVDVAERIHLNFDRRQLLVTNRGPGEDGYSYCAKCGLIEPAMSPTPTIVPGHRKPYPDEREPICPGDATARAVMLGTDFYSDVLLIGLRVDHPLSLHPQLESTRSVLRTLSEALTLQATVMLGISSNELQAEFRPALNPLGPAGTGAEIYMYDTLAGGAGFAQRVGGLGVGLFEQTLQLLEGCPAQCDSACYRCLQGYRNQFEHALLDRHLGAGLLRYLLGSELPLISAVRAQSSSDILFSDLDSFGLEDLVMERQSSVDVPGFGSIVAPILAKRQGHRGVVVALHHPLSPELLLDPEWTEPAEVGVEPVVIKVDELAVRKNLPRATRSVLDALGYAA